MRGYGAESAGRIQPPATPPLHGAGSSSYSRPPTAAPSLPASTLTIM